MKEKEFKQSGEWAMLSLLSYCVCMGYVYYTALRVLNNRQYYWLIGLPVVLIATYIVDRKIVSKHVPLKMVKAYEVGLLFVMLSELGSVLFYVFR